MYWLLFSLSFCSFVLGGGAMMTPNTTESTMMSTTTRAPIMCYSHTCYEQDCLAEDIQNSSESGTNWIGSCNTEPQGYCAIKFVSNTSYYEVTASCESTCLDAGNRGSDTATYCCTTALCNDNENKIPGPTPTGNGAELLSLKWTLVFAVEVIFVVLPLLSLG